MKNYFKILLSAFTLQSFTVNAVEFSERNITTGLIFYEMSQATISYTNWRLTYYYNLTDYFNQINKLEDAVYGIETICKTNTDISECDVLLSLLKEHLENTKLNTKRMTSFSRERSKRSWAPLGLVGDLFGSVLGLMSDGEGEEIYNYIKDLRSQYQSVEETLSRNLLIIESNFMLNKDTYSQMRKMIFELNTKVVDHQKKSNARHEISSLTDIVMLIIKLNEETYHTILEMLENSMDGRILNIIPQSLLIKNLNKIESKLYTHQFLPINLEKDSPYNIFSVSSSRTSLVKDVIITVLEIPIVDISKVSLYKTLTVPLQINNSIIRIKPQTPYFLLNTEKREIIPMTEQDLHNCRKTTMDKLICKPDLPVIVNTKSSCELSMLLNPNRKEIQESCEFQILPNKNYMIKLHQNNSYYCIIKNKLKLTQVCPNRDDSIKFIRSNGVVTIQKGCSLVTRESRFTPHTTISDKKNYLLEPMFDLSNVTLKQISEIVNSTPVERNLSLTLLEDHEDDFEKISQMIKREKEESKRRNETYKMIKDEDSIHKIIGALAFFLLAITIFYLKCIKPCFD